MASHSDTTGIIDTDSRFVIDIVILLVGLEVRRSTQQMENYLILVYMRLLL